MGDEVDPSLLPLPLSEPSTPTQSERFKPLHQEDMKRVETPPLDIPPSDKTPPPPSPKFPNLFCLLELISEQGSGGLVDKVIIAQKSLSDFINAMSPGAYASLTKVDFKALDAQVIQPIGVYGSRESMIDFFMDLQIVDEKQARDLISSIGVAENDADVLRPGLYVARSPVARGDEIYVVFWPESGTWRDDALSSVRRNRETFMRYLTKMTHQILCLFTEQESESFVWRTELQENKDTAPKEVVSVDAFNRFFSFEVAKTSEQEENVTTRDGFQLVLPQHVFELAKRSFTGAREFMPPILIHGETAQGFATIHYVTPQRFQRRLWGETMTRVLLQNYLATGKVHLTSKFNLDAISVLLLAGANSSIAEFCDGKARQKEALEKELKTRSEERHKGAKQALQNESRQVGTILLYMVHEQAKSYFPSLTLTSVEEKLKNLDSKDVTESFNNLLALYPKLRGEFDSKLVQFAWLKNKDSDFRKLKRNLVLAAMCFDKFPQLKEDEKNDIIGLIFQGADLGQAVPDDPSTKGLWSRFKSLLGLAEPQLYQQEAATSAAHLPDATFVKRLEKLAECKAAAEHVSVAFQAVSAFVEEKILKLAEHLLHLTRSAQEDALKAQLDIDFSQERAKLLEQWKGQFLQDFEEVQNRSRPDELKGGKQIYLLDDLKAPHSWVPQPHSPTPNAFRASGAEQTFTEPYLEYRVHALELTAQDREAIQLDPAFVPTPSIHERFSSAFQLPLTQSVLFCQLVGTDRLLLVVNDNTGTISIYFDSPVAIGKAIMNSLPRKRISQERTGNNIVIAYDEGKRMLALHAVMKASLYIFIFDETYHQLQSWAQPVDLSRYYDTGCLVLRMCFVTGSEEILMIDNHKRARIFSLVTQQFRPASLDLPLVPSSVHSSPDGACFIASFGGELQIVRAYHWTTFGSSEGIDIKAPTIPGDGDDTQVSLCLTSFSKRTCIHLVAFDAHLGKLNSTALDITKRATEFMFQQKSVTRRGKISQKQTTNNCLLDCHSDVWTRFPVVPAIQRQSQSIANHALAKRIICVTTTASNVVVSYFNQLVRSFEQKTRKPIGRELDDIVVETYPVVLDLADLVNGMSSRFQLGAWIVDLLCLIPIHLAITKENRFVPLKNGVISAGYERSLLGADVSTVVDSISFGWYESILGSYMAMKPVKVISSMGEQSVGKSYALNHFADTSFAGSAMRTTEGVWMSITPTDDTLIVSLDFEGVHSIERSAQEDTLLVLFNTAVSNLVLFRNNFALSRDITGLFQSFQSSSTVFDPDTNPGLFQSTLVIIIKDVVDSDATEIVREYVINLLKLAASGGLLLSDRFSLKFHKIVQEEQGSNFISRLHRGKLSIVPWPVIQSSQFYSLFPAIKHHLDQQPVTHGNAGGFLHVMKTLMAKLKINDWRSLSQSMAGHRAHRLLFMLANALTHGYSEVDPHPEPLKDFETNIDIPSDDTEHTFYLPDSDTDESAAERDRCLKQICHSWDQYHLRSSMDEKVWMQGLTEYLKQTTGARVRHVRAWTATNLEGFGKTQHASITALERSFDATVINLKANTELCMQQCDSCQLLCLRSRRHVSGDHDCYTSHRCDHPCEFADDHQGLAKVCGFSAGHSGKHICVVDNHLCGAPCALKGKAGCLNECTQMSGHSGEEHRCSSRTHACGLPCRLSTMASRDKRRIQLCRRTCTVSTDIPHDEHLCDYRMCPVKCELCNRLCGSTNHLHALESDATHLCGETHICRSKCSASGICEIDTAPQSIEATFTGRHETFQYTKYSQVAKRLDCVVPIPSGMREHSGSHKHTLDPKPFHYCEASCTYCGYYCQLPLGHSQKEHETSHGSMSRSKWALEDSDAVIELKGRKFAASDEGAPMMCSLFCHDMGRHTHIGFCRGSPNTPCDGAGIQHINTRVNPEPDSPKDWITHELFWKRSGFKDPYSREDQANFALCDAMCPGNEHGATASNPAQPSYCTLPLFHAPHTSAVNGLGYASQDGHLFSCRNPAVMQQAFHVIFVIDRSMGLRDRAPLRGTPVTARIERTHRNRLGAVYSSLYAFWTDRLSAVGGGQNQPVIARRDAYSVILFNSNATRCLANDFLQSPDALLNSVLPYEASGGTNYKLAITAAQAVMEAKWSAERGPVIIFLSDGECGISDQDMRTLCRAAIARGKPLSFHGVSFGTENLVLRRMVQTAREVEATFQRDPLLPAAAFVESSFAEALDSVRLAETFLGIAAALKKPRGALLA